MPKKGVLQLSMNFLVMIIIGIAVLSMSIYFATTLFAGAEKMRWQLDKDTERRIEESLYNGERVAIPFIRKQVDDGVAIFGIGVLNVLGGNYDFMLGITCSGMILRGNDAVDACDNEPEIIGTEIGTDVPIQNTKFHKFTVAFVPENSASGTYIFNVDITYSPDYDQYGDGAYKLYVEVP